MDGNSIDMLDAELEAAIDALAELESALGDPRDDRPRVWLVLRPPIAEPF